MKRLYGKDEPAHKAYLIENDSLWVQIGRLPLAEFAVKYAIVGALECFLGESDPESERRLFEVSVKDPKRAKVIPFPIVEQMMLQYRFGFETNVFLSRLLEYTSKCKAQQGRNIPAELDQYRHRARHYTRLVDAIVQFAAFHDLPELKLLAEKKKTREFYRDGVILTREIALRAISAPSEPLSRYVFRFKKNTSLCREGGAAESMFVLLRGRVSVSTKARKVATITTPGEAFGEAALFLDGYRTASLVAEENTDVYEIRRRDLPRFFSKNRTLFRNIAGTLSHRIQDNVENILSFDRKVEELKEVQKNRQGDRDILEERSRMEIATLSEDLIAFQEHSEIPAFDRFLAEHSLAQMPD